MELRVVRVSRGGFTLIELLIVIMILGLLMAISTPFIYEAVASARRRAVILEMTTLENALKTYISDHGGDIPPCMGAANASDRQNRFTRHLQSAFPRYSGGYSGALSAIKGAYTYRIGTSGSSVASLNLDTLDQAEALVFWLGGMPAPFDKSKGSYAAGNKLIGFHMDAQNPFRYDPTNPTVGRSSVYNFDQDRLVDSDQDGWLEYIPDTADDAAPFVYFDSKLYTSFATRSSTITYLPYPPPSSVVPGKGTNVSTQSLAETWGYAVPYTSFVDTTGSTGTIRWENATTFQIVCGGKDGMYQDSPSFVLPVYTNGITYSGKNFSQQSSYTTAEADNLTSFSDTTVGAAGQAGT